MKKYIKPTSPKKAKISQPDKTEVPKSIKKSNIKLNTNKKQTIYKSQKVTPTKNNSIKDVFVRKNDTPKERKHPEYGTSNLERYFAKEFLDKLGVKYDTQFKAESIGRYYDFYIPSANLIIEIDGSYWHSDPRLYEGKELTPTQKKNKRVDKSKDKWAREHRIPLIRIWEYDINHNPQKVMNELYSEINYHTEKYNRELQNKNRPKNN